MPVLCRRKRSRRQILPSAMPSCIRGKRQRVRTGKGFLTRKGESHCFGWMWNKDQWVLVLRPWRLCRPCPRGRTRSLGPGHAPWVPAPLRRCARLVAGVQVERPGCFPPGFGCQGPPPGVPGGVDRGRGSNSARINSFVREGGGSQWQWPQQWPREGVGMPPYL